MIRIAIYDDSEKDVNLLKKRIYNFFDVYSCTYSIEICRDTAHLLNNIFNYDLLFLDIELENDNGIELGVKIKKKKKDIKIILTSSYTRYLIDGYKVGADRYFIKPFTQREFDIEFTNVVDSFIKDEEGFIDKRISDRKILFKDILYVECLNRKTYLHFVNRKEVTTTQHLYYWENLMDNQPFSKPHKSYLVNLRYVQSVKNNEVELYHTKISLSRYYKKTFEKEYFAFIQRGI